MIILTCNRGGYMKRLVFKKWVNWLILGVAFISAMSLAGECEDTLTFIVSKLVALVVLFATYKLFAKFGRREVL